MEERVLEVALAATFTPDLVKPAIEHWLGVLGVSHRLTVAGYGQLFQELLLPYGLFARTRGGAGVALVRLCDWARGVRGGRTDIEAALRRGVLDFISLRRPRAQARRGAAPRVRVPRAPRLARRPHPRRATRSSSSAPCAARSARSPASSSSARTRASPRTP